jgi:hypothetical protein
VTPGSNPARRLAAWLAFGGCALAAFWIADGVAPWAGDLHNAWHHYEYLTEGFRRGHTYLSVDPDPRLLALPDPYDPKANGAFRLWDASLYRGRYYLYYGPAPAIALMLPWRLVTGRPLSQRVATAALAAIGLAALVLLLLEVRRRHFPRLSAAALGAIVLVAFHASWLPVILRRPALWEVPIVSAAAFLWWALYFLWKFHDTGKTVWAAAGGVALALLMGSRATFVFAAAAIALLYLPAPAGLRDRGPGRWVAALLPATLAFAGGAALLVYNHERFGNWREFGQTYQVFGVDYRGLHFFSPGHVLFNLQTYLFSLPQFGPYFPFLHPVSTDSRPADFMQMEEVYGIVFMMPVHLAGLAGAAWAWRHRGEGGATAAAVAAGAAASVLTALVLFLWGAACSRYIVELVAGWTVVTSVGLMAVFGSVARPRRALRLLVSAAACWSVACVWLASAEFRGFMAVTNPRTYGAMARILDYPSQWWSRAKGVSFGPLALSVRVPPGPPGSRTILVASGRPQRVNLLVLEREGGDQARLELIQNEFVVLRTPGLAVGDGRLDLRLDAPWLYPPASSPYWDAFDPPVARERQTLFRIESGARAFAEHSLRSADPVSFEPAIADRAQAAAGAPYVESVRPAGPPP